MGHDANSRRLPPSSCAICHAPAEPPMFRSLTEIRSDRITFHALKKSCVPFRFPLRIRLYFYR
jgi:hypothetical protein